MRVGIAKLNTSLDRPYIALYKWHKSRIHFCTAFISVRSTDFDLSENRTRTFSTFCPTVL